jgi:hypothetical protein
LRRVLLGLSLDKSAITPRRRKSAPRAVSRIAEASPPLPISEAPKTASTITIMARSRSAAPAVNTHTLVSGRSGCARINALRTIAMGAAAAAAAIVADVDLIADLATFDGGLKNCSGSSASDLSG